MFSLKIIIQHLEKSKDTKKLSLALVGTNLIGQLSTANRAETKNYNTKSQYFKVTEGKKKEKIF